MLAGVVLALAALVVYALQPSPVPVEAVEVVRAPMQVTLDEEGETRVRDRFVISAPVTGRVLRIELEPGDPVKANTTVLATFQPGDPALLDVRTRAELSARVGAAEATLERARAVAQQAAVELEKARRDEARARALAKDGLIPPDQLEQAEVALRMRQEAVEAAQAQVRAATSELEAARAMLLPVGAGNPMRDGVIQLRSPIDGVVLRRVHESEALVPAGEPLLEVGDVSQLEIVSDYLSTDAVQIRPGQPVLIERWGGGHVLRGRVQRVEPSGFTKISALGVEEQRVNVIIDFEDPREAWEQLGDRFRVEVRVVVWERPDVLVVPVSSLVRRGEEWTVFVIENGRAVQRAVRIGQRNDVQAEVLSGLEEGARVIAFPGDAVSDGVGVEG